MKQIRNFAIIAHIDHGKSTLADRILERTRAVPVHEMRDQFLDSMDLERERGITIKANTATLHYQAKSDEMYQLNLIDTPGHIDFSYEVSRSLAACEGAVLLIDASQGVEAQTLANANLAREQNLELIPVLNKIDLPHADIEGVKQQVHQVLDIDPEKCLFTSALHGEGIDAVLEAIVQRISAPSREKDAPLKALIFDSWYDSYRGVVTLVRIFDGCLRPGLDILFFAKGRRYHVEEVGILTPAMKKREELSDGEVGYLIAGVKDVDDARVGDTVTEIARPVTKAYPGFQEPRPMVFAGFFPTDKTTYETLREALEKLSLNDASLNYRPNRSDALGPGFRCGFLGLLHMEITQERLEREFDLTLVSTAPTVAYRIKNNDGSSVTVNTPSEMPPPQEIDVIEEPYIEATIITREESLGAVLQLLQEHRGEQRSLQYLSRTHIILRYDIPLNEMVCNFYDRLKTCSKGYATLDYQAGGWRTGDLVKLDLLVNNRMIPELSTILHRDRAYRRGRHIAKQLKKTLPRQLFPIPIQAAIGKTIISRETVQAFRKDVTGKCYGGDVTRKRKLLEKQKAGKKRLKRIGGVDIPQEAFLTLLAID